MSLTERKQLQHRLFSDGIPQLWCPTITHFAAAATPNAASIHDHLRRLAPYVKGILVPGSTGEGWQMSDSDIRNLLDIVLPLANELHIHVLIGVLKTDVTQMLATLDLLHDLLQHPAVAGFTVCPPKGDQLSQSEIKDSLRRILQRGYPTALYQLPQVTLNEMSPETVASLADEFPNFYLFKDTSGADRVALSGIDLSGVFLVRGSEQSGYAQWPREAGGPYDGFLLSTANAFAPELSHMLRLLQSGQADEAKKLSADIQRVVSAAFDIVANVPQGNAFANANK
jgi:dihydrodipicolinate synthase/N-acetylneuraminate lyase